jgi:hypothetical protein
MTNQFLVFSDLSERDALAFWESWEQDILLVDPGETYVSPDGQCRMVLTPTGDTAFGPTYFEARLLAPNRREGRLRGYFLSPGRFGRGFSQFGGNPFSPDSTRVALVAVDSRSANFQGQVLKTGSGDKGWDYRVSGPLLHHSWSPSSNFWLAQQYGTWLVFNPPSQTPLRIAVGTRSFPKHAAFCESDLLMTFLEPDCQARLLSLPAGNEIASIQIPDVFAPFFSFPLPTCDGLALASGVRFGGGLHADRWIVIRKSPC